MYSTLVVLVLSLMSHGPKLMSHHRMHTKPVVIVSTDGKWRAQFDTASKEGPAILNDDWSKMPQSFKDQLLTAEKTAWGSLPNSFSYILLKDVRDDSGRAMCGPFSPLPTCITAPGKRQGCGCGFKTDTERQAAIKAFKAQKTCVGPPEVCSPSTAPPAPKDAKPPLMLHE